VAFERVSLLLLLAKGEGAGLLLAMQLFCTGPMLEWRPCIETISFHYYNKRSIYVDTMAAVYLISSQFGFPRSVFSQFSLRAFPPMDRVLCQFVLTSTC
jgi:hypothetical protein